MLNGVEPHHGELSEELLGAALPDGMRVPVPARPFDVQPPDVAAVLGRAPRRLRLHVVLLFKAEPIQKFPKVSTDVAPVRNNNILYYNV